MFGAKILEVRASVADRRTDRYCDPITKPNKDGTFEVRPSETGQVSAAESGDLPGLL
ncbi:MAG: hypothetical protein O2856_01205 [Planctomycetota bacterium]|nr:hypothetical protein [Planctomycetota bacterium]